jgi:hypothetical protein
MRRLQPCLGLLALALLVGGKAPADDREASNKSYQEGMQALYQQHNYDAAVKRA